VSGYLRDMYRRSRKISRRSPRSGAKRCHTERMASEIRRRGSQPAPEPAPQQLPARDPAATEAAQAQEPAQEQAPPQPPAPAQPAPQLADRRCSFCQTRQPIATMRPVADSWMCSDDLAACQARATASGLYPRREDAAEGAIEQALAVHQARQGAPA
jgi:hypothetical protein